MSKPNPLPPGTEMGNSSATSAPPARNIGLGARVHSAPFVVEAMRPEEVISQPDEPKMLNRASFLAKYPVKPGGFIPHAFATQAEKKALAARPPPLVGKL